MPPWRPLRAGLFFQSTYPCHVVSWGASSSCKINLIQWCVMLMQQNMFVRVKSERERERERERSNHGGVLNLDLRERKRERERVDC